MVLNESSVVFLMGRRTIEREQLLNALRQIADNPTQNANYAVKDSSGRPMAIKIAGRFLITFWADHFVRELRVINIETV